MHLEPVQVCSSSATVKVAFFRDCIVPSLDYEVFYCDFRDSWGNPYHETW